MSEIRGEQIQEEKGKFAVMWKWGACAILKRSGKEEDDK